MKILYVHQYFTTPEKGGGTRSYYIAKEMLDRGHSVTMITSDLIGKERSRKSVDGIDVITLPCKYKNSDGSIGRIRSYTLYVIKAIWEILKLPKYDLAFVTSTPLTVGYVARFCQLFLRLPYVFEVRDLWPEFPIQMGAIKSNLLIKYLRAFERRIYNNSLGVIALSPGMEEGVRKTATKCQNIVMIPNMSKPDIFFPRSYNEELASENGLKRDAFKIVYFGSLGKANGIEYILKAAHSLYIKKANVQFVFLGKGIDSSKIEDYIQKHRDSNVLYLGSKNTYITSDLANCCQASITTFIDLPVLYTNSPNKLFDSLSAGLPIIVNSNGWTRKMVEENECGVYVDPSDPGDLARKICELRSDPELCKRFSSNARALSLSVYDKSKLCTDVVRFIETVAKS